MATSSPEHNPASLVNKSQTRRGFLNEIITLSTRRLGLQTAEEYRNCEWMSEYKYCELVLCTHHVHSGDQTQVNRLGSRHSQGAAESAPRSIVFLFCGWVFLLLGGIEPRDPLKHNQCCCTLWPNLAIETNSSRLNKLRVHGNPMHHTKVNKKWSFKICAEIVQNQVVFKRKSSCLRKIRQS